MSRTERTYALLVEANPVPDPGVLPERLVAGAPRLHVIDKRRDPMQTEPTQLQTPPPPTRRNWLPALGAAAIVIAVLAAGVFLLADGGGTDVATEREAAAIASAEAYLAAINAGDVEGAVAVTSPDGSSGEADRSMLEFNTVVTARYPWQLGSCEVAGADNEVVLVDCAFVNTDPVFVAAGVSELIAPFTVHDDGRLEARVWQGANFSLANDAYADYLRTRHETDYNLVCHTTAYAVGTVNHDGGMVFTAECANLAIPLSQTIAEWVEAGKPAP